MVKNPIGILDMGIEGLGIISKLAENYRSETFIYLNDMIGAPYEGRTPEEITKYVSNNIELLNTLNLKMLLVVSDTILEYCSDLFKDLSYPVLPLIDLTHDYINEKYEQKNMVIIGKDGVLKANLYQKDLVYNHLFAIPSDEMEKIILGNQTKTSKSFKTVQESLKPITKRDIEALILTLDYLQNLRIEINEYLSANNIITPYDIFADKINKDYSDLLLQKGKGKVYILSQLPKKEFFKQTYWFDTKCKYFNVTSDQIKVK